MSFENLATWNEILTQEVDIQAAIILEWIHIAGYLSEFLSGLEGIFDPRAVQGKIVNDWYEKISFPNRVSIKKSGRFFSIEYTDKLWERQELCYDILWEWESLLMSTSIHEAIELQNEQVKENIDQLEEYIDLMEWIFQRNSQESSWDFKAWNGYIWEEDIVLEWQQKWMHLKEVQSRARKALKQTGRSQLGFTSLSPKQKIRLEKLEETYLHMTMWVWDLYQIWWHAFAANQENETLGSWRNNQEISVLISRMVLGRAPNIEKEWWIFEYYYKIHNMMNDAYAPDKTTQIVYAKLWESLNAEILDYINSQQREHPEKQEYYDTILLQFARMLTGRGTSREYDWQTDEVYNMWRWQIQKTGNKDTHINMWEEFRDPELAAEILTQVMSRKWGVLEKIYNSWNILIEDPEVGEDSPSEIVSWAVEVLQESLSIISRDENGSEISRNMLGQDGAKLYISQIMWTNDIVWMVSWYKDYVSMPLDLKVKISAIARLKNKLHENKGRLNASWHTRRNAKRYTNENFWEVLEEIIIESFDDTMKSIENNFWFSWNGDFSKDLKNMTDSQGNPVKFSQNEIEIFNVFHDIAGTGLFNLSDKNKWHAITWAKIIALLAVAFALTAATWWIAPAITWTLIRQWATMWLYAAPASWVIFPEWHTSTKEMLLDRWSDILISSTTWALWWVAAHWLWKAGIAMGLKESNLLVKWLWARDAKMLSGGWMRNGVIFWGDLYFLWMKTEQWRNEQMAEYFHSDTIMSEK